MRTISAAVFIVLGLAPAFTARAFDPTDHPTLHGTVVFPEPIALPPGAVVVVRLEAVADPELPARPVTETRIPAEGRRSPVPFEVAYDRAALQHGKRYFLRATVLAENEILFVTRSPYRVLTSSTPSQVDIVVEPRRAIRRPSPNDTPAGHGLSNTGWKLVSLGGETVPADPDGEAPSLVFEPVSEPSSMRGYTGCNRFSGAYATGEHAGLRLEPKAMTLMACPEKPSAREKGFLDALRATTGYRIDGDSLELLQDSRVLARFVRDPPGSGTH